MRITGLRAFVSTIIGFGIVAPAYANGQVENAMQLWLGDLRTAYDQTVELLANRNINAGKEAVTELQELTYQMSTATVVIRQNAAALAPELGAAWADTERAMNELHLAASALKAQVGVQRPVVDPLKSALANADNAVNKSWEFTKNFGKEYGELMGGHVENAKQLFDNPVSEGYEATLQYLDDYPTDRGKQEVDRLKELIARLYEVTYLASTGAAELARPLSDMWKPTEEAVRLFQIDTGIVQASVGDGTYDLGNMKSRYANLNAAIVRSYKDIQEFGAKFRAICDDWS
jgi:hypothetical protein